MRNNDVAVSRAREISARWVTSLLLVAVLASGCSPFMHMLQSNWTPEVEPRCSTSAAAPAADAIVAAPFLAFAAFVFAKTLGDDDELAGPVAIYFGIPPAVLGLSYAISSGYGFSKRGQCELAGSDGR